MNQETPVLSRGSHQPGGEFCLMEHVSVRAGLPWSDRPGCTHPALARAAIVVNDRLGDGPRQQLLALEDDLMACPPRPELEPRLSVALGAWAARHVLPVFEASYPGDHRPRKAIEAAEAWLAGGTRPPADAAANAAAYASAAAAANAAADAADAAAYAADAADAAAYAADAANAAAYAAAAAAANAASPADHLKELIGQYQDLTARLTCGG
jgi:hypothetical protein